MPCRAIPEGNLDHVDNRRLQHEQPEPGHRNDRREVLGQPQDPVHARHHRNGQSDHDRPGPGVSLAIDGSGYTLSGAGSYRGLVVTTGTVLLENLTIAGAKANGSQGTAGGALLVGAGGIVTLENMAFSGNTAAGGGSDICLQQGGSLIVVGGGSLSGDTTGTGLNAGVFIGATSGTQYITLEPGSGQTLSVGDAIADKSGATGSGGHSGLVIAGGGTVKLTAAGNDYTGGTTIQAGSTLELGGGASAGSGAVVFSGAGTLQWDGMTLSAGSLGAIAGFSGADVIDLAGIAPANVALSGSPNNGTINGVGVTGTFSWLAVAADGHGGSFVQAMTLASGMTLDVASADMLNQAIAAIDAATPGSYEIRFTANITDAATDPHAITLPSGVALTIDGGGYTLDGMGSHRGFVVTAGSVKLENLAIADVAASSGGAALAVQAGASLVVASGTVRLSAATGALSGQVTVGPSGTLEIGANASAGSGTIAFSGAGTLLWDGTTLSAGSLGGIAGFSGAGVIDLAGMAPADVALSGSSNNGTINGVGVTGTFGWLAVAADGLAAPSSRR